MYIIDRAVAILKPKQPFVDWLRTLPDPPEDISVEELQRDSTVILIPDLEYLTDADAYLQTIYPDLFEHELDSWYRAPNRWPQNRTYQLFKTWFDVDVYEMVLDTVDDEISREA